VKLNRQRVMHCPCGKAKVLALGLCSSCYTLKRQDEATLVGYGKQFWSGMATVAACAMSRAGTSALSSCTTAYPVGPC